MVAFPIHGHIPIVVLLEQMVMGTVSICFTLMIIIMMHVRGMITSLVGGAITLFATAVSFKIEF